MSCAICLEDLLQDHAALGCGHVFHYGCIEQLLTRFGRCALCRVRTRRIIPLFIDGICLIPVSPITSTEPAILGDSPAVEPGTAILESPNEEEADARRREDTTQLLARSDFLNQRLGVAERKLSQMRQLLYQTRVNLRDMKRQQQQIELQNVRDRQIALVSYRQYNTIAKEKLSLRKETTEIVTRMLAIADMESNPENLQKMRDELDKLHKLVRRPTPASPSSDASATRRSSGSQSSINTP